MNLEELKSTYLKKKQDGMDFSQIRKELLENGISEQDTKEIIKVIDNQFLQELMLKSKSSSIDSLMLSGIALTTVGVFLSLGTYFGWINLGNYYIIAYGPILSGLGILTTRTKTKSLFESKKKFKRK